MDHSITEAAMRLAAKLVLLFLVGVLLIVLLFAYLTIQLDRRLALAEHQRHAAELADAVQHSVPPATVNSEGASPLRDQLGWKVLQFQQSRIRVVQVGSGDESRRPSVPAEMIVTRQALTTIRLPDETGNDHFYTYVPLDPLRREGDASNGSPAGADLADQSSQEQLEISSPDPGAHDRVRRSILSSLLALLGVTALSGIVIIVGGVRMVGRPLRQLIEKVQRIGQGDFSEPIQLGTSDELASLGEAINQMCTRLEDQRHQLESETASRVAAVEQLRHAERLNMVGRMAAGIAHEIGTPLNVVSGRAELIASGQLSPDTIRESAKAIQSESQRITKIVRQLLDFARPSPLHRLRQELRPLIVRTAELMEPLAAKHQVSIHLDLPEGDIHAQVDSAQIQQVLTNLIVNAIQAIGTQGRVAIKLDSVSTSPPDVSTHDRRPFCRISVSDSGRGIAKKDLPHVFEPFFTTKDVGEGTGLGLSISHGIIQEHQGWIEVVSEEGQGSTFSVYLPGTQSQTSK